MARPNFTAASIDKLKPPKKGRIEKYDGKIPGFGVRVTDKGVKTWIAVYTSPIKRNGKPWRRRYTIGRVGDHDLADARDRADRILRDARAGIDPIEKERQERLAADDESKTFRVAVDEFVDLKISKQTPRGQKESRRPLESLRPEWGYRNVADIGRLEIIDLRDRLVKEGKPYAAERTVTELKRFFRWCVDQGKLDASPAALVASPFGKGERKPRKRKLDEKEIGILWPAFEVMAYPFGHYLESLLVTGQRRSEVATMRWPEIDLDKKRWTIPAEKTKSEREHIVPLSSLALDILEACPRFDDEHEKNDYVFSSTGGSRPISGFSKLKNIIDVEAKKIAEKTSAPTVENWRLHDFRRTMTTMLAEIGIKPHILGAVINHSPGSLHGVTAIYNLYEYLPEKKHALEAWGRKIGSIIRPEADEKVVPIRG
ncbi:MAG: tyrosine-type recombinase/integrase [Proteobacteria bacterium]|nr:tyrosine-type recombinase/integrase [Pseudomonadota bacterium]